MVRSQQLARFVSNLLIAKHDWIMNEKPHRELTIDLFDKDWFVVNGVQVRRVDQTVSELIAYEGTFKNEYDQEYTKSERLLITPEQHYTVVPNNPEEESIVQHDRYIYPLDRRSQMESTLGRIAGVAYASEPKIVGMERVVEELIKPSVEE